ncbi:hypothetical protein FE782_16235 [Paenibacillus antri]|uniref:Uncharacterized protein n=1 Tax=Paenibacillus antri TaxID=2582848 RepID=A0A5R9G4I7_9BACL|nr:hypothetical protein [Paenibacillus antri]TLS51277.1 hypothetical protein FE782_16235 [Paenibacillus antri]
MKRYMYRSTIRRADSAESFAEAFASSRTELETSLMSAGVRAFSLFRWDRHLFAYLETDGDAFRLEFPPALQARLEAWPGEEEPRYAVPMVDIFHDGEPIDRIRWRAGRSVEESVGALARLKPEQYASYVFYHYQMQEEQPETFNQTYLIGSHERLLFSYSERPASLSGRPRTGKLRTKHTPNDWQEVMEPHFEPWTDAGEDERLWRKLERICSFGTMTT